MDGFTTLEYLISFPGMIATVILLTQFTKGMFDTMVSNNTKYIVFFYALMLCIVAAVFQGNFTTNSLILQTILVWLINSVIIWFAAMKTFELVVNKKQ